MSQGPRGFRNLLSPVSSNRMIQVCHITDLNSSLGLGVWLCVRTLAWHGQGPRSDPQQGTKPEWTSSTVFTTGPSIASECPQEVTRAWALVRTLTAGWREAGGVKPRVGWDNQESSGTSWIRDTFSIAPAGLPHFLCLSGFLCPKHWSSITPRGTWTCSGGLSAELSMHTCVNVRSWEQLVKFFICSYTSGLELAILPPECRGHCT